MDDDDESNWWKQVLIGIGVLLGVAVLIAAVVAVVGLKAADVAGITTADDSQNAPDTNKPLIPRNANTPSTDDASTNPTGPTEPTDTTTTTPSSTPPPKPQGIKLTIFPTTAGTYERVDLTGTWPGHNGVTLQVQRKENGAWADFPTDASISGGSFHTYIETGHTGLNRIRMYDASSGKSSNVATVTIG